MEWHSAAGLSEFRESPYTFPDGHLSATGKALDGLLRRVGYSVHPDADMSYPYLSDLVQRYPGRSRHGGEDREPTPQEIDNCWSWLEAGGIDAKSSGPATPLSGTFHERAFVLRVTQENLPERESAVNSGAPLLAVTLAKSARLVPACPNEPPNSRAPGRVLARARAPAPDDPSAETSGRSRDDSA